MVRKLRYVTSRDEETIKRVGKKETKNRGYIVIPKSFNGMTTRAKYAKETETGYLKSEDLTWIFES